MLLAILRRISPILLVTAIGAGQTRTDSRSAKAELDAWIDRAAQAKDSVVWANDLMHADEAAARLEQDKPAGCCGVRCLRVGNFELHYRFNSLSGQEEYQHDILQSIVMVHEGSKDGADALVRLLSTGCETFSSQWVPLFRTVLGILEQKRWKDLADPRLTEIRGEAYETWWSLSKIPSDDWLITDGNLNRADFADGESVARTRAIADYETLVKTHRASADVVRRLAELRSGHDTEMRKWLCWGD